MRTTPAAVASGSAIPVGPFRERFLQLQREGWTAADVAGWLGWADHKGSQDAHRVFRTLGLVPYKVSSRQTKAVLRTHVSRGMAVRLAEVLNLDPHEVGL